MTPAPRRPCRLVDRRLVDTSTATWSSCRPEDSPGRQSTDATRGDSRQTTASKERQDSPRLRLACSPAPNRVSARVPAQPARHHQIIRRAPRPHRVWHSSLDNGHNRGVAVRVFRPDAYAITSSPTIPASRRDRLCRCIRTGCSSHLRHPAARLRVPRRGHVRGREALHDARSVCLPSDGRRARLAPCGRGAVTDVSTSGSARTFKRSTESRAPLFAVWAPSAKRVSVVGDFNGWDGRLHPMRC